MADTFRDNPDRSRFELTVGPDIAFAAYRRTDDSLAILHVEAPVSLRGTGAAGRLMAEVVGAARREGRALVPYCGYAAAWLRRHPQPSSSHP